MMMHIISLGIEEYSRFVHIYENFASAHHNTFIEKKILTEFSAQNSIERQIDGCQVSEQFL